MYFFFGPYLWKPNDMMMAFGGDALVLYYNTVYHACYGNGVQLENMNYPFGELIFMTDAQGMLSLFLMGLSKLGVNTCDCAVGFIHVLNHYSILPATIFMYYILVSLKVDKAIALIFSVLIIFLSPQMLRFTAHYGLSYLFVIPMVILFCIRKYNLSKFEKRDAIFFIVLMCITFNNPYLGFIGAMFGIVFGGLVIIKNITAASNVRKSGFIIFMLCALSLIVPYLAINGLDVVEDRIKLQWGFTSYASSFKGSFYPHNTMMNNILSYFGSDIQPVEFEAIQYIGFATIIAIIIYILVLISRKWIIKLGVLELPYIFLSALILYLYSSNVNIVGKSIVDFVEQKLGFLLMFKASGRIGWPFYFALTIFGVLVLDRIFKKTKEFMPRASYLLLLPFAVIWMLEINMYTKPSYENVYHANFFSSAKRYEFKNKLEKAGFKPEEYQALLCVPKTQFWSDKFLSYNLWTTHFYATMISLTYEIPMANALLSRPGTSQNANGVQLLSNPLIVREAPIFYPDKRDILIVLGKEHPDLSIGEQFVIDQGTKVYEDEGMVLYKFPFHKFFNNPYLEDAHENFKNESVSPPLYHIGYDENKMDETFYGEGSLKLGQGNHEIMDHRFENEKDTVLSFAIWTKIDNKKYWLGDWRLLSYDSNNNLVEEVFINPRNSYDVQHQFVKASADIKVSAQGRLKVEFMANQEFIIDELIVDYKGNNSIIDEKSNAYFLHNGFKILKRK
jgi:hypothetical protein